MTMRKQLLQDACGKCAYCAHRKQCAKEIGKIFGFCNTDFELDSARLNSAVRLARRLRIFAEYWDAYGYRNDVESKSAYIADTAALLMEEPQTVAVWLNECLEEEPDADDAETINKLLRSVRRFY